ncbi:MULTISPECIES: hypothetical protein [Rhizobium]|uniref:Uncharacterized protein n=1 Tax=Rhizobium changzhiense TaxID=2692317 RepID=A0A7Z0UHZ3_9HYPH|nr:MULTISPECIES: hypothetical protein [Rhizobium]NKL39184.1 hypothetical protein [Rhizobium leguminosarum bv. viciae]MBA5800456.1 hypothetical protein [Rhizobium changzhiense]MCH4547410.1 hypothetical protein [Rhizobium changzhiense]MCW0019078.1 hypothetical protein [Rhizobium sp. BT-226]NZD66057.1 hypothetical protein [Rhizobium changzhiense]
MNRRDHASNCPACRQGRLFLFRNLTTDDIYAHCEECEWGYLTPAQIETKGGFLTLLEDFDADYAESEAISRSVWANYIVVAVDDQDET